MWGRGWGEGLGNRRAQCMEAQSAVVPAYEGSSQPVVQCDPRLAKAVGPSDRSGDTEAWESLGNCDLE